MVRAAELGTPAAQLPILWVSLHLVKMGGNALIGRLADRVRKVRLISAGWLLYAAIYVVLAVVTEAWHVWLAVSVYGLYYGLCEAPEKALVRELATPEQHGRAFGWYHGAVGIAAVPAGALTGILWQAFGAPTALLVGAAFAAASSGLLVVWCHAHPRGR